MNGLTPQDFTPSRRTRALAWWRHRRLHHILMDRLQAHGESGEQMRCVHCGQTWMHRGGWLENLGRKSR